MIDKRSTSQSNIVHIKVSILYRVPIAIALSSCHISKASIIAFWSQQKHPLHLDGPTHLRLPYFKACYRPVTYQLVQGVDPETITPI